MKKAIVMGMVLLVAANVGRAASVTIYAPEANLILQPNWSDLVQISANYYIGFYNDGGTAGPDAIGGTMGAWNTGSDTLITSGFSVTPSWQVTDGFFSGTYNTGATAWGPVFGRVYNTSADPLTQSTFSYMNLAVCDGDGVLTGGYTFTTPADPAGQPPAALSVYLTNDAQNHWQYVPEPGTMVLFGLGAVTMAIRRFRRK